MLGLFLQLSANVDCGKVYTGELCPQSQTLAREHEMCVVSSKGTRTKSTKGSYYPFSWLGKQFCNSPTDSGASWEGTIPCCGEVSLVLRGTFQPRSHTWLLGFIRCTIRNMKGQKYNRNQRVPVVEREMMSEKQGRVASCLVSDLLCQTEKENVCYYL